MSGITAQSATKTLGSGDTSVDNSTFGYVTKEQISLGLTGSPTTALWSLSKPSNSGAACLIDNSTSLSPLFSPDVEGTYVITCVVDSSITYVLRIDIVNVSVVSVISAIHILPCQNSQIPVPRSGVTIFFSSDSDGLAIKLSDGSVEEIQTL